jgi:hypothetical protein
MTNHTYDKDVTALVVVDPYNDFISEGGNWNKLIKSANIRMESAHVSDRA